MSVNNTFNPSALPNTQGKTNPVLAVEIRSNDPTLVSGQPRIWFNTTDNKLKISTDGATTKSTVALT